MYLCMYWNNDVSTKKYTPKTEICRWQVKQRASLGQRHRPCVRMHARACVCDELLESARKTELSSGDTLVSPLSTGGKSTPKKKKKSPRVRTKYNGSKHPPTQKPTTARQKRQNLELKPATKTLRLHLSQSESYRGKQDRPIRARTSWTSGRRSGRCTPPRAPARTRPPPPRASRPSPPPPFAAACRRSGGRRPWTPL